MYLADHGNMMLGDASTAGVRRKHFEGLWPYFKDLRLMLCPLATKTEAEGAIQPYVAYEHLSSDTVDPVEGPWLQKYWRMSYATNSWSGNKAGASDYAQAHWKTALVKNANEVPLYGDTAWYIGSWPQDFHSPPKYRGDIAAAKAETHKEDMLLWCIDRHNSGMTNTLYMDLSVRETGLKELWTLRWNRTFDICKKNGWTMCGGKKAEDWPKWMRKFKDY
jgi:hypothetical protein